MTGGFLALFDDIVTILDDIATNTKVAAAKSVAIIPEAGRSAGQVLGDDIAVGAQTVTEQEEVEYKNKEEARLAAIEAAKREIPIVWAIFKGSLINKMILVPAAIIIAILAPSLITAALVLGGLYLCLEGFEKVYEHFFEEDEDDEGESNKKLTEKDKIKGAIRTDMILSLEVIVLTLGFVATFSLATKIIVLSAIAVAMSVVVYGLIALIIRMDDAGYFFMKKTATYKLGLFLVEAAPKVMRVLGVIGTVAMFSVGGSILLHLGHFEFSEAIKAYVNVGIFHSVVDLMFQILVGLIVGAAVFRIIHPLSTFIEKVKNKG